MKRWIWAFYPLAIGALLIAPQLLVHDSPARAAPLADTCQTYASTTHYAIPDDDANGVVSSIIVPSSAAVVSLTVTVHFTHTYPTDLQMDYCGPRGCYTVLEDHDLTEDAGEYTISWSDLGSMPIGDASPPYIGLYLPYAGNPDDTAPYSQTIGMVGQPASGVHRLWIRDLWSGDDGSLLDWSVTICGGNVRPSQTPTLTPSTTPTPLDTATPQPLADTLIQNDQWPNMQYSACGLPVSQRTPAPASWSEDWNTTRAWFYKKFDMCVYSGCTYTVTLHAYADIVSGSGAQIAWYLPHVSDGHVDSTDTQIADCPPYAAYDTQLDYTQTFVVGPDTGNLGVQLTAWNTLSQCGVTPEGHASYALTLEGYACNMTPVPGQATPTPYCPPTPTIAPNAWWWTW